MAKDLDEKKRDEILKRMLETPPTPHKAPAKNVVKKKAVQKRKSKGKGAPIG